MRYERLSVFKDRGTRGLDTFAQQFRVCGQAGMVLSGDDPHVEVGTDSFLDGLNIFQYLCVNGGIWI
jgi:hypothetical protein